ncbi:MULTISPECIES: hypothetical protein [unclassified Massilia]|uniref:hypothetical protein n=1 Tax=unclassified Massilia TaxID=2609279 RepID=UPI0017828BBF|nr:MULTISPECIES: hypothetical protein [unclassified Massilia]MBD8533211.1 hypothetical protein [Massilia sp. CFBP 13647]MBD8672039.1 hypothetical protein [Massilia sp. CFBP 13721]
MATIVIHDLPESSELDRQAMHAIAGGSRFRSGGAGAALTRASQRRVRLFDLAPGSTADRPAPHPQPR